MKTIWKFPLKLADIQSVEMPKDAIVLSVDMQDGVICLWAMVESGNPVEARRFYIAGTGNLLTATNLEFIGTVQTGAFVWHVFEYTGE